MSFRSLRYLAPIVAVAGFLAPWGCSATTGEDTFTSSSTTTSVGQAGGGTGGTGGAGSGNTGQGGFDIGMGGSGQGGGDIDPDAACAATSTTAESVSLDIIVLLDRSGSMYGTKWNGSVDALTSFVSSPASAGLFVGLQFFPISSSCDPTLYDDLAVPIAELPMNQAALTTALDVANADGSNTPMWGALYGVLTAATQYQDANPNHKVIVVFASDGYPGGCSGNDTIAAISALAQSARNYNGVQTYVIAINGSSVTNLNQIAAAGGTVQAFDVTNDITLFQQAMEQIRTQALTCEFPIPPAPDGLTLDLTKVALKFTDGMNPEVEIPRAADENDCGVEPGWYYNRPMNEQPPPDRMILCPASCTAAQGTIEATVSVYFGCEPVVK